MDNFNNNGGMDEDRTVLIQQDDMGNPTVQPQGMPMQPQFGQAPQEMPQFNQAPQGMPAQPQFGQAPQGMPMQPQFGQVPQGMPQQPQFGQAPQGMPQYNQMPQMNLNNGGNNNPPKKGKGGMIAIISVCAVAVVALIVGLVLILGGKDKDKDKKTTEETTEETTEATTTEETTEATTEETTEATTEATTTEATTEATTETASPSNATADGSSLIDVSSYGFTTSDWKSLELAIDGKVYSWPITYAQLKEAGYSVDSNTEHDILESNYYTLSSSAEKDGERAFYIRFKNYTDTDKTIAECDILGFSFDTPWDGEFNYSMVLCNGITLGTSFEDVMAVMGTPTDEYVSEDSEYGYRTATYEVNDAIYANKIQFTFENGVVDKIDIVNHD